MSKPAIFFAAAATAASLAWGPAHAAGVTRAWVSGHGTDAAGCGAPTSPCRSLQYVHDSVIAPGGEIDILDPAGYGSLVITKSISIVNDGVGTAGVQQGTAGEDAIHIAAGEEDAVMLKGLNIDGLGVAGNGVYVAEAGKLTLVNCVIRHFAHDGVYLQQGENTLTLSVIDTIAADNANDGFDISPMSAGATVGVIDHSDAITNGSDGVVLWGVNSDAARAAYITVSNSDLSNNGAAGVYAKGAVGGMPNAVASIETDVADYDTYGFDSELNSEMLFHNTHAAFDTTDSVFINAGGAGVSYGGNVFDKTNTGLTQQPTM